MKGMYPVVHPQYMKEILSTLKLPRIMTSVAYFSSSAKKTKIHKTMNFDGEIFLDCGVFQRGFYKRFLIDKNIIPQYRKKLIEWYSFMKPNIASSLDIPSTLEFSLKDRLNHIRLSINNYEFMKRYVKVPLVLGVTLFSRHEIDVFKKELVKREIEPEYIGLGGQVPLIRKIEKDTSWGKLVVKNVFLLSKSFNKIPIHVYGCGDHRIYSLVRMLGASSSDYAGYVEIAARGAILLRGTGPRFIFSVKRKVTPKGVIHYIRPKSKVLKKDELKLLSGCECPVCKHNDPIFLEENKIFRIIHNLYVTYSESRIIDRFCNDNDVDGLIRYIRENYYKNKFFKIISEYAISLLKNRTLLSFYK